MQDRPEAQPPDHDVDAMARALGWKPSRFRTATPNRAAGATAARWIVSDERGRSAFVKVGATAMTADWIRAEHRNYVALEGDYLPKVLGFDGATERPVLALEDLSAADWPSLG